MLSEQEKKEEQGFRSDLEELQKVYDLFGKGSLMSTRTRRMRVAQCCCHQLESCRPLRN